MSDDHSTGNRSHSVSANADTCPNGHPYVKFRTRLRGRDVCAACRDDYLERKPPQSNQGRPNRELNRKLNESRRRDV